MKSRPDIEVDTGMDPLAGRLANGDPAAPGEMVGRHRAELVRYATALLRGPGGLPLTGAGRGAVRGPGLEVRPDGDEDHELFVRGEAPEPRPCPVHEAALRVALPAPLERDEPQPGRRRGGVASPRSGEAPEIVEEVAAVGEGEDEGGARWHVKGRAKGPSGSPKRPAYSGVRREEVYVRYETGEEEYYDLAEAATSWRADPRTRPRR